MRRSLVLVGLITVLVFCACKSSEPTETTVALTVTNQSSTITEEANAATLPVPTLVIEQNAGPQRIEFESEDGTPLVGTFWPTGPDTEPVPGILLMHWNPGTREDWTLLAALLQGMAISSPSSGTGRYGVFAFDFRGHGESGGSPDDAGYLMDARAALALMKTLPGIDPDRIVMLGASIGADAAVDACNDACIGAIALSPGNFIGMEYVDAVAALGNKPVLCAASENDGRSADICRAGQEAAGGDYQVQIYQGATHGMDMFEGTDDGPALTDVIFAWLAEHAEVD
jgi:dienelactone hydrolase